MKTETEVILPSDPRAAHYVTDIKGWVSRDGRFYGNDERLARWAGSTHNVCDACGAVTERPWTHCAPCRARSKAERHAKRETKPYNGEPIYSDAIDKFFFDEDELLDYLADDDAVPLNDLQLVFCKPQFAREIDTDIWCDELPDDHEVPGWLTEAVETLNQTIREREEPLSWVAGQIAVDVTTIPIS